MIDLTDDEGIDLTAAGLFTARRATLFSVRVTDETTTETFGRPRARR